MIHRLYIYCLTFRLFSISPVREVVKTKTSQLSYQSSHTKLCFLKITVTSFVLNSRSYFLDFSKDYVMFRSKPQVHVYRSVCFADLGFVYYTDDHYYPVSRQDSPWVPGYDRYWEKCYPDFFHLNGEERNMERRGKIDKQKAENITT